MQWGQSYLDRIIMLITLTSSASSPGPRMISKC